MRLRELPPDIRAVIVRRERAERDAVDAFLAALIGTDPLKALDCIEALEMTGTWRAALRKIGRLSPLHPDMQAGMLALWVSCGDSLRSAANSDVELLDALRVMLPAYTGPAITLYRGDSAWNRRRRSYGPAWSAELEVARDFAKGMWRTFQGGSVVLQTEASPDAILCAVHQHRDDTYEEVEYLVDRRRLGQVKVLEHFEQRAMSQAQDAAD